MKSRHFFGVFVLFSLSLPLVLQAQSSKHRWALGMHPGAYSYSAFNGGFFKPAQYGGGVEFNLMRRMSDGLDLGVETGFARIWHPLDVSAVDFSQRDNFFSGNFIGRLRFDNGKILPKDNILSPYIKAGAGVTSFGDFSRWNILIPVGLGLSFNVPNRPLAFHLQTGLNYDMGANRSYAQHSLGMSVNFGKIKAKKEDPLKELEKEQQAMRDKLAAAGDRDYDGVPDEIDECPDIFGSALTGGCPDSDGDGVKDSEDLCPDDKGFANLQGCLDRDRDGVVDPLDECPEVYGATPNGCPAADPNDRDGDGVPNEKDLCPDEPGSFLAQGCPDRDGDGIADKDDLCADYYGIAQHQGCPIPKEDLDRLKKQYEADLAARDALDPNSPNYLGYNPNDLNDPRNPKSPKYNPYAAGGSGVGVYDPNDRNDPRNPKSPLYNSKYPGSEPDPNNPNDPRNPKSPSYNPKYTTAASNNTWAGGTGTSGRPTGGIFVGNPVSEKFGANVLTGFAPYTPLSPEDQDYCQRLDLSALKAAIYFEYNDSRVSRQSVQSLDRVVEVMRRCAMLELQIAGHTDADGTQDYNLQLSERRAKAVLDYVTGKGVDNRRLKYNAYGKQFPAVPNTTKENRQQNRRAEVRVNRGY